MAGLQFNMTGLNQGRKYVVFVGGSEAAESKLAKLETSHTGKPPTMVSGLVYSITTKTYFHKVNLRMGSFIQLGR